jgi:uncharacterized protein
MPEPSIIVLGAGGALGRSVTRLAVESGYEVTLVVRSRAALPADVTAAARVHECDLQKSPAHELAEVIRGHGALICCAGYVTAGHAFVELVGNVIAAVELLEEPMRPRCWFIGGAAALQVGDSPHKGIDLPKVKDLYWPHGANLERLERSTLAWSLLCPGPMVEKPPVGIARMRISANRLPVQIPRLARWLPKPLLLPFLAARMPEMIIPYADAATLMLMHLDRQNQFVGQRVGMALPAGMRGKKATWTAKAKA